MNTCKPGTMRMLAGRSDAARSSRYVKVVMPVRQHACAVPSAGSWHSRNKLPRVVQQSFFFRDNMYRSTTAFCQGKGAKSKRYISDDGHHQRVPGGRTDSIQGEASEDHHWAHSKTHSPPAVGQIKWSWKVWFALTQTNECSGCQQDIDVGEGGIHHYQI
jgi:hypothetical protein